MIEAYQYAFHQEPVAAYEDESVPVYTRLYRGPNTWPDHSVVPGFRPAVEALSKAYLELAHELGHLIMECLGEDPAGFRQYFDTEDPHLVATLNHNFSLERIDSDDRDQVMEEYGKPWSAFTGAHIDGPPLIALLMNDKPGLEVIAGEGVWVGAPVTCRTAPGDYAVPVIPGSVIVNSGGTLMHLSRGRVSATLHRVNTSLIPFGESRISMPYFLRPNNEGPLVPFGDGTQEGAHDTGYTEDRDRGAHAAANRMRTFPQVTKRWWANDFKRLEEAHRLDAAAETQAARVLSRERGERNKRIARL